MIWLTWRQFRTQAAVVYAALALLALTFALTRDGLGDLSPAAASSFFRDFTADDARTTVYFAGYMAVLALPAIVGLFWGAPLVTRELEAGTHRLAWNQTVTRTRWLATKLACVGLAAIAAAALLGLLATWWSSPLDAAVSAGQGNDGFFGIARISPAMFDARGIAPIGCTAFAFALGVTAGILIRRTVPAMAVTLAVFVAVQVAMPVLVRPHLGPTTLTTAITAANLRGLIIDGSDQAGGPDAVRRVQSIDVRIDRPGAWIISNETVRAGGGVVDGLPGWVAHCAGGPEFGDAPTAGRPACFARLAEQGIEQRITYQPASRYWTLQAYELAIFSGLALLLTGFCFWRLRRLA